MLTKLNLAAMALCLAVASPALAYSISGNVTCQGDGSPLAGIDVTATAGIQNSTATTDASGDYTISGVGPSVWDMSLDTPYPVSGPAQVDLTSDPFAMGVDFVIDDPACSAPFCGDGNLDDGEECDDGNDIDGDGCSANCTIEPFCGDGVLDEGEQCDDGNLLDGDGCSALCTFEFAGEGCTPGYWRQSHHYDSWEGTGYTPGTLFVTAFGVDAFPGHTLGEVVDNPGGGLKQLGFHAVAALLNAASPDVDYDLTPAQVVAAFQDAYASGDYRTTKDLFADFNEQGCPID